MTQLKQASFLLVAVCLTCGLVGQSETAHGQNGFGGYYGGYGIGYGWGSGYGYNAPLWYNRNGYYSPPIYPAYSTPYAAPYVTPYAVPQYTAPNVSVTPGVDGGQIVLFVAADASSGIQYTLNGQPYSLKPGESQKLVNDRPWTIEFPATSDGQIALRYSLVSANYKFKASGTGIGLFQTQDQPPAAGTLPPTPTPVPNPPSAK